MPGVTVASNHGNFGPSKCPNSFKYHGLTHGTLAHNGFSRPQDDMSISEIKTMAKEAVRKEARGASALTLIKTARNQLVTAKDYESQGNLKGALSAITKAASLAQMTMDTAEFAYEVKGKGGVLRKEFTEFLEVRNVSFQGDLSSCSYRMLILLDGQLLWKKSSRHLRNHTLSASMSSSCLFRINKSLLQSKRDRIRKQADN